MPESGFDSSFWAVLGCRKSAKRTSDSPFFSMAIPPAGYARGRFDPYWNRKEFCTVPYRDARFQSGAQTANAGDGSPAFVNGSECARNLERFAF
jgi:hypothetical protein